MSKWYLPLLLIAPVILTSCSQSQVKPDLQITLPNINTKLATSFANKINNYVVYNLKLTPPFYSNTFPNLYNKVDYALKNPTTDYVIYQQNPIPLNNHLNYDVYNRSVELINGTGVLYEAYDDSLIILTNYHNVKPYLKGNYLNYPNENPLLTLKYLGHNLSLKLKPSDFIYLYGKKDQIYDYAYLKVNIPHPYKTLLPQLNAYYNPLIINHQAYQYYSYDFDNSVGNYSTLVYDINQPNLWYTFGNFHPGSSGTGLIIPKIVNSSLVLKNHKVVEYLAGLIYGTYSTKGVINQNTKDKYGVKIGTFLVSPIVPFNSQYLNIE